MDYRAEQPYQHATYHTNMLLAERAWSKADLLNATEDLTVESLQSFIPFLFSQLHLEFLIHGNVTKQVTRRTVEYPSDPFRSEIVCKHLYRILSFLAFNGNSFTSVTSIPKQFLRLPNGTLQGVVKECLCVCVYVCRDCLRAAKVLASKIKCVQTRPF